MRTDMFELLLERPRAYRGCRSRRAPPYPRASLAPRCLEDSPHTEALGGKYAERSLNENLTPLVRWLERQVGRPWRLVYSDIAEHLSPSSAVKMHVRDHVSDYVATRVVTIDGVLHGHLRRGVEPLGRWRRAFYVCPRTGLLRAAPSARRTNPDVRNLADGRYLLRRHEVWHLVETAKAPEHPTRNSVVCAYTGLALGSRAYGHARATGRVPWPWDEVAVRCFVPKKSVRCDLFREAEATAKARRAR